MISKAEVVAKVAALKAYSVGQEPLTEPFFTPLEEAVETYFSSSPAGLKVALEEVVLYGFIDLSRRTTEYEFNFDMGLPSNFPIGYNDVRECFYGFTELMTISNEDFYTGFTFGVMAEAEAGAAVPVDNIYINKWVEEMTAAVTGDVTNVQALAKWLNNASGSEDLINLLENRGKVVRKLTVREKANVIYYDRKLLEVIQSKGVNVYVPSYFL